jgi:hypothetical protein
MNNEIIEKFVETAKRKNQQVNVHFKTRSTLTGVFVTETLDYAEMKKKNFWRIVPESRMELWKKTKDLSLSRLFSGSEFTRLSDETAG